MYYHDQKNRREGEGRGGEERRGEGRRGERRGERGYFTLFISLETGFGGWPTSSNRLSPWPKKFPSLTPIECAHVYSVCAARLTISLLSLSCHSVSPPLTPSHPLSPCLTLIPVKAPQKPYPPASTFIAFNPVSTTCGVLS